MLNLIKIKIKYISQPPCFNEFTKTIKPILQFFEEKKYNKIALTN